MPWPHSPASPCRSLLGGPATFARLRFTPLPCHGRSCARKARSASQADRDAAGRPPAFADCRAGESCLAEGRCFGPLYRLWQECVPATDVPRNPTRPLLDPGLLLFLGGSCGLVPCSADGGNAANLGIHFRWSTTPIIGKQKSTSREPTRIAGHRLEVHGPSQVTLPKILLDTLLIKYNR